MEIEICESLFFSWLRHIKDCKMVHTNWKSSPRWSMNNSNEIEYMLTELREHFKDEYDIVLLGKNTKLTQINRQGETDLLGEQIVNGKHDYYAVDVAFHKKGLSYKGKINEKVVNIMGKCIRSAFWLYGYLNKKSGHIYFDSPKIRNSMKDKLDKEFAYINNYFKSKGFDFNFVLYGNDNFQNEVLDPVLNISNQIDDTNELFLRAVSLIKEFKQIT